jgi:hypothetical protein
MRPGYWRWPRRSSVKRKPLTLDVQPSEEPVDVEGFLHAYITLLLKERGPVEEVRDEGTEESGTAA